MAIMVAGGLTFAIPGTAPVAYAAVDQTNANLYVSAEGQDADNQFAEGNIIEVIILDSTIGDTGESEAEPTVTVNGADLRMLQTGDGNWRAYFAQADALADTDAMNGQLDYGEFCSASDASTVSTLQLSDTNGVYFPPGSVNANCAIQSGDTSHPLIRETRTLTDWNPAGDTIGQLGLANENLWPFIQVFDFASQSDVRIVYEKGGQQTVTLTYDDPSESHSLNSERYPQSAHVLVTINDYALNIDPTDEDMWAFDTQNGAAYYNLFDEDGTPDNIMDLTIVDYAGEAGIGEQISIVRNGQGGDPLINCQVTKDFGIQDASNANMDYLVSNDDSNGACVPTDNITNAAAGEIFTADNFVIGFVEDGSNNDAFINWAEDQRSNLVVRDDADRNRSFEIDYSSPGAISGIVSHFFADMSIDVEDGVWNSGERVPFTLTDADANVNPLAEDNLEVANPKSKLIPTIKIGEPITLASASGDVAWFDIPAADTTAPVITLTGGDVTVVEGAAYVDPGVICMDTRDGELAVTTSGNVNINTVGTYTLTYTCTDTSGNEATTATRTVTVTDGTPPTITLTDTSPVTVRLGADYTDAGATCSDPVDGVLDVTNNATEAVDTQSRGSYTVTYTCTDTSGNEATATRTVVVTDSDSPTIVIRGSASVEVPQGSTYMDEGAECADNADDDPSLSTSIPVDTNQLGTYSVTYTCVDSDGNITIANRVVTVTTPDTTRPTLTLNGPPAVQTIQGSTYVDQGATCTDERDSNPVLTVTPATVDTNTIGTITLVYSCTDASGNSAPTVQRTVEVTEPDTTPPVIRVVPLIVSVVQNSNYTDDNAKAGVTCTDNFDTNPTLMADITTVDTTVIEATYRVTYTCTDASGNSAEPESRTVRIVEADNNNPIITLRGDSTISLTKGDTYNERGATCSDDTDGPISEVTVGGDKVDTATPGTYRVTYTCTDSSNNGVTVTRTVIVTDNLTLLSLDIGEWDDGSLKIGVTGKTALPGVQLDSSKTIEGLPTSIAAEFGTGMINQNVTIKDISIHGDTEFYLTATQGNERIQSNPITRNIPNALGLTGVAIALDVNDEPTNWEAGLIKLNITGSIGVSSASLVTSDGKVVAHEVPITNTTTGSIDSTDESLIELRDISLAGKTVQFELKSGDVTSHGTADETDIPMILNLTNITFDADTQWSGNALTLTVTGTEEVGNTNSANYVNLVVKTEDGYQQVGTTDDATAITDESIVLNDIRISGSTEFRLNFTDTSGNNTMSNSKQLNIPKILELDEVGKPGSVADFNAWNWETAGLSLSVNGTANVTTTSDNNIILVINGDKTETIVNDLTSDTATVTLSDSTLQNKRVVIGVTYTDTENRTVTDTFGTQTRLADTDLKLASVTPGVWNVTTGVLPLTITGNTGGFDNIVLYVNDIETGLEVTNEDDGVITAVADLPASEIAVSGMTNFTLGHADGIRSNTVEANVPPAFLIEDVIVASGWSAVSSTTTPVLSLRVTGYENVTGAVDIATHSSDTTLANDLGDTIVNATTGAFSTTVALDRATYSPLSNQEIQIYLNAENDEDSANYTLTVPSALILDDLEVDRTTLGKMRLVSTGSSFLTGSDTTNYNNVVLAIYASMDADSTLIPTERADIDFTEAERNPDGSFPIESSNVLDAAEDAAVSGKTVYIRLEATSTVDTEDKVVSEMYKVTLPAASGSSVDLTPTPASFFASHSGFPPITRAVIGDVSEIPDVHNVQMTSPQAVYTWADDYKTVESYSERLRLAEPTDMMDLDISGQSKIVIYGWQPPADNTDNGVRTMFNWNFDGIPVDTVSDIRIANVHHNVSYSVGTGSSGLADITDMVSEINALGDTVDLVIMLNGDVNHVCDDITLVADFFSFGQTPDGERVNNAIYRIEVEEASTNSDEFEGTVEYVMLNQLNYDDPATYSDLRTISDEVLIVINEDFTDEDAVRINYLDLGADGVETQISTQEDAATYSGIVTFDQDSYKIADTVVITVDDADLNVDNDVIDIYTFSTSSAHKDKIGSDSDRDDAFLLDVTFDDELWTEGCGITGFEATTFTLAETTRNSGIFTGDFQIPSEYCQSSTNEAVSVTGTDIEVNYQDFRDASGNEIEVGAGAAVRASTGTVSLDRTVYPVPFNAGEITDAAGNNLPMGDLTVYVHVTDPDYDVSAAGEDTMPADTVSVSVIRGSQTEAITISDSTITEVAPDAGVFKLPLSISYDDGPAQGCPQGFTNGCILQGDILQVEYEDPTDASGEANTVTDSATFDLRNGVLQSDKSVYIIGSDMILTLIEPDFDLDGDSAETYTLDLIEWDSDADTVAMGSDSAFDPEPNGLRETGDNTGIFQSVIEIPSELGGERLDRGEEIELEYVDYGPSGSDYVGDETEDITLTVFTSNFGATIELDQKVYTWTDKVYITIVAPDHNFDGDLVDEIGDSDDDPVKVSTRSADIDNYKLVETGPDTGIFTGEIILIGFDHNADGNTQTGTENTGYDNPRERTSDDGSGPTDGFIETDDDDGITVSFEFSEDETVVGSALIRWNIGEVQWLESSYPASGTGVVRVIDPDMNLNPEAVDNFEVDIWSDRDQGGIDLTVTETNQATGIFEGTVFFTTSDDSSGHRLRVAESNTVTAEYEDNTLPEPYNTGDELNISATTLIGTQVPPLERAPISNLRIVDAHENSIDTVAVDQQVQVVADLVNGQDRTQEFAYLVQIQDESGVTVSLAWISGTLEAEQSLTPSASWIPTEAGEYTATAFVWESIDTPTALSPPATITITVN